jgi:ketosteroid isomerase-like protein
MREDVEAVLAANREFYRAFTERDLLAMHEMWASECPVACVHPGWDMLVDRDDVMESWKGIFSNPGAPAVICNNEVPYVMGDVAFVLCHEILDEGTLAATNIFRSFDGVWRMVHHHSTPMGVAPAQDLGPVSGHVH